MRLELDKPEVEMGSQEELSFWRLTITVVLEELCPTGEKNRGQGRPSFILEVLKVPRNNPGLLDLIEGGCEPRHEEPRSCKTVKPVNRFF